MLGEEWQSFFVPVWLSIKVSLVASLIVAVIGGLTAWKMSRRSFRGYLLLETILLLPLVLPPTVVGFLLLMLLGRRSWVGQLAEWLFAQPVIFTWWAAVIASVVVAFPLVYQTMKNGFASVDSSLLDAARSIGAGEWQMFRWILIPLAYRSILSGYLLGFARSLGEFGATLMIAGNIPGRTQTIPTAIYVAVDGGNLRLAWLWAGTIVLISFLIMLIIYRRPLRKRLTNVDYK